MRQPYEVKFKLAGIDGHGLACMLLASPEEADIRLTEKFGARLMSCTPRKLPKVKPRTERRSERQS